MKKHLPLLAWMFVLGAAARAAAADWPQFQGPLRNNRSAETGLLQTWPAGGPRLLWTATGCGKGYSSVAVAGGLIYTAGTTNGETVVLAFDLDGKPRWRASNGTEWQAAPRMTWARSYDGARATPTVNDGLVYHLNETGVLSAFDAQKGAMVWSVNVAATFRAQCPDYGYTESVLIDGNRLFCFPGGSNGFVAALDKKTGATLWAATNLAESAGFASPILADDGGGRQLITLTRDAIVGVSATDGALLWRHPFTNKRRNNIPTPIYTNGFVFASTGYGAGSILLKLSFDSGRVTPAKVWESAELDNIQGGVALVDGFLYGSANDKPAWVCLDFATGQLQYREPGPAMGSFTYADGRLYCLSEKGTLSLVPCTPQRFAPAATFEVPKGGAGAFWARPVIGNSRLYIRHADCLYAYDIRAR